MYEKILIILILHAIARSEEMSSVKNMRNSIFFNQRLSTILPYPSSYNDENFAKDNPKKWFYLSMPLSQTRNEEEKPKVKKTKRCDIPVRKDRLSSVSIKENFNKARDRNPNRNINTKISKKNSDIQDFLKNAEHPKKISNKMETDVRKSETFLNAVDDKPNAKDVIMNLKSREEENKCKEEKCIFESSRQNLLGIDPSRRDKRERINYQRRSKAKDGNTRSNILQQILPRLYSKNRYELRIPRKINSLLTKYYKDNNIPHIPLLYEITSYISPYIVGNDGKFINTGFPITPFEDILNFLVENNVRNQHQPIIHRNLYSYLPVIQQRNRNEDPAVLTTLPSTNRSEEMTFTKVEGNLESCDTIGNIGKNREDFPKLITKVPNYHIGISETDNNFHSSYSNDVAEKNNAEIFPKPDKTITTLEDSTTTTTTVGNQNDDLSTLSSFSTDYIYINDAPIIANPSIMHNEKFINMEECIKLFGSDVCVFSTTSPGMCIKQIGENNLKEHSTIRLPEYILQSSTKTEITLNDVNYTPDTTNPYFALGSFTKETAKLNTDRNKNIDLINTESYTNVNEISQPEFYQYAESTKQIYEPDKKDKSLTNVENTEFLMKKLTSQANDKTINTKQNKIGKSKNCASKLLLNSDDVGTNPVSTSDKEVLYFTRISHASTSDEEAKHLAIGEQNRITNVNSWSNTHHTEKSTIINSDSKGNVNEKNKNLKVIDANIYFGKDISQEQFKEENTINRPYYETGYNFEEETTNKLIESKMNTYPEGKVLQGQPQEVAIVTHNSKIEFSLEKESADNSEKLHTETYFENETLQRQSGRDATTDNVDFKTESNFEEETTKNYLIESRLNIYPEEKIPQEVTSITHNPKIKYGLEKEIIYTNDLQKSNSRTYFENEILRQLEKDITTNEPMFKTEYNIEGKIKEIELKTNICYGTDILREQPTTKYFDYKKLNYLNGKESTVHNLETTADMSIKTPPFDDNTLLLSSIRKVINDFTLDDSLIKMRDLDESILHMQGKDLFPEILQVPNLKSILLIPQIEDTIIEKVKDVLSDVTTISKKNFTNDWLHSVIKNALRKVLEVFSESHQKLPPMTVEEHQFHDGHWMTNLVTLTPVPNDKLSITVPDNLRNDIRNLLSSSTITSQRDQNIVRNIIVQTIKTSLIDNENEKIDDSIIRALNDVLQTLKDPENVDAYNKRHTFIIDKENMNLTLSPKMSTTNYIMKINTNGPILNGKSNLDTKKDIKIEDKQTQTTNYHEDKALENNTLAASESPNLLGLREEDKSTCIDKEKLTSLVSNKDVNKLEEKVKDRKNKKNYKIEKNMQNHEKLNHEKDFITDINRTQTIHSQEGQAVENNTNILIVSEFPNSLDSSEKHENIYIEKKTSHEAVNKIRAKIKDKISDDMKEGNMKDNEEKKPVESSKIITYHKATLKNNQAIPVESNLIGSKKLNEKENIENILIATTISSAVANDFHGKEKSIVDVMKIKNINEQNEEEDDNSDLWQQSISNLNLAKESSIEYNPTESTDKNFLEYHENDWIKIHTRNDNKESTINYNLPDIPKDLNNHCITDEGIKIRATNITSINETSPYYLNTDNPVSEDIIGDKNIQEEIPYTLNEKKLSISNNNLISPANAKYENQESNIAVTSSIGEIDPVIILERIKYNLSPIKYYSPEILKNVKNHYIDDGDVIRATTNLMQETFFDHAQVSNDIISQGIAKDIADEMKYTSNGETLVTSTANLILLTNKNDENHESNVIPSIDDNILKVPQQEFTTKENIIKIHEVTTEFQQNCVKSTNLNAISSNENSGIDSSLSIYEVTDNTYNNNQNENGNSDCDDHNLIDNKRYGIDGMTEANEVIVSSSKVSSLDDSSESFLSSTTPDDILDLQKSQLYYINNNNVKLPLEIIKLKNGSYALSISKNICEQILHKKCPCCVPLQGYVIQTSRAKQCQEAVRTMTSEITSEKENNYVSNIKENYQSSQSFSITATTPISRENILRTQKSENEEKRIKAHCLWKRNMNKNNFSTTPMPIIDFVNKYHLLLNSNEAVLLNETALYNKIQNYDKSLIKSMHRSKYDQSEEKDFYNNITKTELSSENKNTDEIQHLIQKETSTWKTYFSVSPISQVVVDSKKNSTEFELQEINPKADQSEIIQRLKSCNLQTKDDILNVNNKQNINFKHQEENHDLAENIKHFTKEIQMKNEEIKTENIKKGNIFHGKKKKEHDETESINEERIETKIKENYGRPYRYQRNTNGIENKKIELVKSMIHWFKGLFLNK